MTSFIFATGIENSNPTIDQGRTRRDQMAECGFYDRWREDFALVREIGCGFLRFGPPIHRCFLGPGRIDWEFADLTLAELRRLRIVAIGPAEVLNAKRFLSLDLNDGRRVESEMYEYLMDNGMTREEYRFVLSHRLKRWCVMGNDYYVTNEHLVGRDGSVRPAGEVFGYATLTRQYHDRYRLAVMDIETNLNEGATGREAEQWLCSNGPTCCACAMTACRWWASPGTR